MIAVKAERFGNKITTESMMKTSLKSKLRVSDIFE